MQRSKPYNFIVEPVEKVPDGKFSRAEAIRKSGRWSAGFCAVVLPIDCDAGHLYATHWRLSEALDSGARGKAGSPE